MEWKIIDVEDKQEWSKYATLRDTRNDWKEGRGAKLCTAVQLVHDVIIYIVVYTYSTCI